MSKLNTRALSDCPTFWVSKIEIFFNYRRIARVLKTRVAGGRGEGGGWRGVLPQKVLKSWFSWFPFFPSSLSPTPTPFDACYAGYLMASLENTHQNCAFQKHANSEVQKPTDDCVFRWRTSYGQNFTLTGSKGHRLWFVIGGFRFVLYVSVFQGSLLVIVIMIDGSEKRNCEGGF